MTNKRLRNRSEETNQLHSSKSEVQKMTALTNSTNGAAPVNPSTAPVLDLDQFRLPQDFADIIGVAKILTKIPVRKPDRQAFIRVHPDPAYQLQTSLLELKDEREFYLLGPGALSSCANEAIPMLLHLATTRLGNLFIWPVRLPNSEGRDNDWHASAREAALQAQNAWVSVRSNMEARAYDVFKATANIPDPQWPAKPFNELVALAFKGRIIMTPDHDVLLRLGGEK
jgi:hypothetical protein